MGSSDWAWTQSWGGSPTIEPCGFKGRGDTCKHTHSPFLATWCHVLPQNSAKRKAITNCDILAFNFLKRYQNKRLLLSYPVCDLQLLGKEKRAMHTS